MIRSPRWRGAGARSVERAPPPAPMDGHKSSIRRALGKVVPASSRYGILDEVEAVRKRLRSMHGTTFDPNGM